MITDAMRSVARDAMREWFDLGKPHGKPWPKGTHGEILMDIIVRAMVRAEAAAWQPIETAPKGLFVLLWEPTSAPLSETHSVGQQADHGWYTERGYPCEPTHWRPLPDPPQEKP